MKKTQSILIAMLFALSMVAFGQSAPDAQGTQEGHGEGHGHGRGAGMMNPDAQLEHMSSALNLTDEQKTKIKPILEDTSKKMQQLRQDSSLSEQDKRAKMQEIHQDAMSQVKPILTADQQKKFESMHGPHGGQGEHGRKSGHDQSSNPQ